MFLRAYRPTIFEDGSNAFGLDKMISYKHFSNSRTMCS